MNSFCKIIKERVLRFTQFIQAKGKEIFIKSNLQFQKELR